MLAMWTDWIDNFSTGGTYELLLFKILFPSTYCFAVISLILFNETDFKCIE